MSKNEKSKNHSLETHSRLDDQSCVQVHGNLDQGSQIHASGVALHQTLHNALDLNGDSLTQVTQPARKRGRPKCFNEQQALQQAMILFWRNGYEGTSISDLTSALGVTAPSLYSSFGDKAQLFQRCLDYYIEHETCSLPDIFAEAKTPRIAIEMMLYENLNYLIQAQKPKGCMLVTATMNCSEENKPIQQQLLARRQNQKSKILNYLKNAQAECKLSAHCDVEMMTDFYITLLQGMTIQARDGIGHARLKNVIDQAMKCWDAFE